MTDRGKPFIPYAFPGLPIEDAYRLAASRVRYDRLIEGQEAFLEDAARRWRSVGRLRAFLGALEKRCAGAALTAEMRSWLAWAHAHCDELDPLSAPALEDLRAYARGASLTARSAATASGGSGLARCGLSRRMAR